MTRVKIQRNAGMPSGRRRVWIKKKPSLFLVAEEAVQLAREGEHEEPEESKKSENQRQHLYTVPGKSHVRLTQPVKATAKTKHACCVCTVFIYFSFNFSRDISAFFPLRSI